MLNRDKSTQNESNDDANFIKIGESMRETGFYVPFSQKTELTSLLLNRRAIELKASQELALKECFGDEDVEPKVVIDKKSEVIANGKAVHEVEPCATGNDLTDLQVDCVHHDDLVAQKKAADTNTLYADRTRVNTIKELTKALLARPMTRKVGMPEDVDAAMQKLAQCAPHIPRLVQFLQIPLQVAKAKAVPPMIAPILLVGPAGVGKSHVALQIADILGVPAHNVSYAASSSVGNVLSGADKNWGNSSTGIVFNALANGDYANPVICLDELDKASTSQSTSGPERNPLNELLALLEPVTAKAHKDRCAEIRVDARHIVWIATANSLQGLSTPLLSRFELVMVNKPDARAAVTIALSVTQSVNAQMGVELKQPSGEVLQWLATLTPRLMRRIWTTSASWTAAQGRNRVTMNDISMALGVHKTNSSLLH